MGPIAYTSKNIAGNLTNFAKIIQVTDPNAPAQLQTLTELTPGTTTVTLKKEFVNTMDVGKLTFTF
jgi:hypothetical protein